MILGLPTLSFLLLLGVPGMLLVFLLYDAWRIYKGNKD